MFIAQLPLIAAIAFDVQSLQRPPFAVPVTLSAPTTTTAIKAANSAYSMEVTPRHLCLEGGFMFLNTVKSGFVGGTG